ncbi:MAG: zinc ribbon domain-containing protein, partial [Deltaproteobacteria bacterium]|nr:zinc ribbon domain-containing protein [Deltaproteobacteria bacterium]
DASETQGAAGAGLGMGMGLMRPAMFADVFKGSQSQPQAAATCPECGNSVLNDAKFCSHCGHQLLVFKKCLSCGKNLTPGARFCSRCGEPAEEGGAEKVCPHCQTENLPESVFCNQCGERL